MNMHLHRSVVGLVAHVDAGKTTLSEALLFVSGALRRQGRVDHGDAWLDTDAQEKERGITIFSKQAIFSYRDFDFTLLDTPGHADFSGETERAVWVMDMAVLVVSAADGVQSHTRTLWQVLQRGGVPVLVFVNKADQPGFDKGRILSGLRGDLGGSFVDLSAPDADEEIATCGEEALEEYLAEGRVREETARKLFIGRKLFPVCFGAALKNEGIEALLEALYLYAPRKTWPEDFSACVYKIGRDPAGQRLTYMKITGGRLRVRDALPAQMGKAGEKVSQIRLYSGARFEAADEVPAGTLCAVTGPEGTHAGQRLGGGGQGMRQALSPVLSYRVALAPGEDEHRALACFRQLEQEDPQLNVVWLAQLRRIQVEIMGEVQLEVLARQLKDRFGLEVRFTEGGVLYRETIRDTVEGAGHYEPLRHYAEVHLLLSPGPRGSGITVSSQCPEDDLAVNWQRLILTHVLERQHRGVLTGAPLTDVHVTLLAGRAHLKHTEGGDFRQATYRAIRQGLMQASNVLLEPWYQLELWLPAENAGRALTDIAAMGGEAEIAHSDGGITLVTGKAPVRAARHYPRDVAAYTHGLGRAVLRPGGYEPCAGQDAIVTAIGYDPERDIENPADSVFCSHGAGVVVPWREAAAHMHVRTGFGREAPPDEAPPAAPAKPSKPHDALEEDKELMAIFERTYGPIRSRSVLPARKPPAPKPTASEAEPPEEYLIVDGYNIIFAWDELKKTAQASIDSARQALIALMCNYQGMRNNHLILVFDAYLVPGGRGSVEQIGGITVVYTSQAETADAYIEKTTSQLGRNTRIRVASSDGLEQLIILGNGALRVSAREFRREVEQVQGEIADFIARNNVPQPSAAAAEALKKAFLKKNGDL